MSLNETLANDMKSAMKAREAERVSTLRMVLSALSNEAIAMKKKEEGLGDDEVVAVLHREAKRRQEAASEYEKGGRSEQAAAERREYEIIRAYLPEQMSQEALHEAVRGVVEEMGASGPRDMGRVMGAVMGKVGGRADGNAVRAIVEELLSH